MNYEQLHQTIQQIYERHGGQNLAASVVEEASDPEHLLHESFEWDEAAAATAHRLTQARGLITRAKIRVVTESGDDYDVRAFHAFRRVGLSGRGYVSDSDVRQSPEQQKLLLQSLHRDWAAAKKRYGDLAEFWQMVRDDLEGRDGLTA